MNDHVHQDDEENFRKRISDCFHRVRRHITDEELATLGIEKDELLAMSEFDDFIDRFEDTPSVVDGIAQHPSIQSFHDAFDVVLEEVEQLVEMRQRLPEFCDVDLGQQELTETGAPWRVLGLRIYGNDVLPNCALMPKTMALIRSIPDVPTALISVLDGRKRIPEHIGASKAYYRHHMPLIVPTDGESAIRVGDHVHHWKPRLPFTFCDCTPHEVWNETDALRVNITFDYMRSDLHPTVRTVVDRVFAEAQRYIGELMRDRILRFEVAA